MPTPDDEQFETYLKQFRPLLPDALPTPTRERAFWRHWSFAMWSVGAAAVLILSVIGIRRIPSRVTGPPQRVSVASPMQPLTMREANALLAAAPSYKAVLNEMAFHPQRSTVLKDKQSAVAVLSKEKIKL